MVGMVFIFRRIRTTLKTTSSMYDEAILMTVLMFKKSVKVFFGLLSPQFIYDWLKKDYAGRRF